ncbi:glutathione S-transferase [Lutimaribacter sp. EGI FJ00015]|uniref:Glutathione S-transferase n=1 Tax=Lutimaribacter degradans TaxID=2945989 RepID=A0ACC6A082_9RHOB|nr:glutathione S-transferase [Lutimaribacter sp. EGI FJ00013]MCM2563024.1 glutathione S-transferase [Lutimaribacter sp. EGI FJ00013]MCO0614192.1 glutathione S-transferase [Lutimaribacter sp. EGI FJ00015]MCO0636169.1 glutathione S-transferase [Lutimaribacter sp. EGI FJ00014]
MIFYDCSTAPNPRRARMVIVEKGLTVETHDISIAEGQQLSPEFLKINPRATVPVLITDDGTTLTENIAIATYLEAVHPEPPLMGRTPDEKGLVAMWNAIVEFEGGVAVAEAFRNSHPAMKGRALPGPMDLPQIPELAERGLARVSAFFELLNDRLSETPWLAGDAFSLADISAFVFTDFARVIKMRPPEDHAATHDWLERMRARPSAAA